MRPLVVLGLCLASLGLAGCGNTLPNAPTPTTALTKPGPHGGTAYPLLEGQGYAELVNEPPVEERGSKVSTSIVVYFLGPDAKESATTTPTDVNFVLNPGKSNSRTVVLKAEPKSGDPVGGTRFVSEMGPFRVEDLRGDLNARVGGKPAMVSLVGGR